MPSISAVTLNQVRDALRTGIAPAVGSAVQQLSEALNTSQRFISHQTAAFVGKAIAERTVAICEHGCRPTITAIAGDAAGKGTLALTGNPLLALFATVAAKCAADLILSRLAPTTDAAAPQQPPEVDKRPPSNLSTARRTRQKSRSRAVVARKRGAQAHSTHGRSPLKTHTHRSTSQTLPTCQRTKDSTQTSSRLGPSSPTRHQDTLAQKTFDGLMTMDMLLKVLVALQPLMEKNAR